MENKDTFIQKDKKKQFLASKWVHYKKTLKNSEILKEHLYIVFS